jgi:hypothetical protein
MTTQVLISPLVTMGDNQAQELPRENSPPLLGIAVGKRAVRVGSSAPQQRSSTDLAETTATLEIVLADAKGMANAGTSPNQQNPQGAVPSHNHLVIPGASTNHCLGQPVASAVTFKQSPLPVGETGIVSHLRNSTSSRHDIESSLRAKGFTATDDGLSPGNPLTRTSLLNPVAAAAAVRNQYAALLLQGELSRKAALSQLAMSGNASALGMLPSPSALLASQWMGRFGDDSRTTSTNTTSNNGGGGIVMDPRFMQMTAPTISGRASRGAITLFMQCDTDSLSEYQCLIRQQIELFEADKSEAASSVQGRNKQILEGQVGIRCRHCASVPPRSREKGSMYFPTKLDRIYQAAQNLSAFHLCMNCKHVPDGVRKKILRLRERKSPAGGGKRYWGEGVRCLGVVEESSGLRVR